MAGTHLPSTRSTPASGDIAILALRGKRHSRVDMLIAATLLSTSEWGVPRRGLRRPLEQPQPSPRGGFVASGPRTEPMQPVAVGGGDLVQRGASAEEVGVEGRFGPCSAYRHVDAPKCEWATLSDGVR